MHYVIVNSNPLIFLTLIVWNNPFGVNVPHTEKTGCGFLQAEAEKCKKRGRSSS